TTQPLDHPAEAMLAQINCELRRERCDASARRYAQGARCEPLQTRGLSFDARPSRISRQEIGRQNEERFRHGPPGQSLSFPPILPCLAIVASTSTMDRAASSDVMSALSYGGETSTTSIPAIPSFAMSSSILRSSRGRKPPGSGQPVPG